MAEETGRVRDDVTAPAFSLPTFVLPMSEGRTRRPSISWDPVLGVGLFGGGAGLAGVAGGGVVGVDGAVADGDDAVGEFGDVGLVGDDDDGVALGVEVVEEGHDLVAGFGVEVSGGLVGG